MKVYIGPFRHRWISNVHTRHMDLKYGRFEWDDNKDWEDRQWERFEDALQWLYNHTINLILDKRSDQRIKVRIDNYDTWSMDHTLAHIVVPMLKQLNETKHGSPWVDDEDVPEEYRSTNAPPKENEYDIDAYHHYRWDWVLYEMIWAFEQKTYDWESQYYGEWKPSKDKPLGGYFLNPNDEGRKAHQERMNNGFRLFGKYYEALWD